MKQMIFLLFILAVGCSSTRNKANDDTVVTSSEKTDSIPACILEKIEMFNQKPGKILPEKCIVMFTRDKKYIMLPLPVAIFFPNYLIVIAC